MHAIIIELFSYVYILNVMSHFNLWLLIDIKIDNYALEDKKRVKQS